MTKRKNNRRRTGKDKEKYFGVIPIWCCGSCAVCVLMLLLLLFGGFGFNFYNPPQGQTTITTPTTTDIVHTEPPEDHVYSLYARLNGWEATYPPPYPDIEVEAYEPSSTAIPPVHSGVLYGTIFIGHSDTGVWYGLITHTDFVIGHIARLQVWGFASNVLLTVNDYYDYPVGASEVTLSLYDATNPGVIIGSMSFKWV